MGRQLQMTLDADANHRALRRCHACGSYSRPFEEVNGRIRCERCARRARRDGKDESGEDVNTHYLL